MKGKKNIPPGRKAVLLFDGYCNLCSALVDFALKRDRRRRILFGALQDRAAKQHLGRCRLPLDYSPSVVLVEPDRCRLKSDAVLGMLRLLGPPWSLLYPLILIPRFIRDPLYDTVARLRHRLFGRRGSLRAPGPGERERFITRDNEPDRG